MPIAATDNTDRIEQLILLTEKLASIIRGEAELLRARRTGDLAGLEAEKSQLAKLYSNEMGRLRKDKTLLAGVPKALIETLKDRTRYFQAALAEHETILTRMKTVTERMVRSIASEIEKSRAPRTAYGPRAVAAGSRPAPFALNQVA